MLSSTNQNSRTDITDEIGRHERQLLLSGALLATLIHLLFFALLLSYDKQIPLPYQNESPIEVDIVPSESLKWPEATPAPLKPEPSKAELSKPEPKAEPLSPKTDPNPIPVSNQALKTEDMPHETSPPPPPPQLTRASIAEKSSAPPSRGDPSGTQPPPDDLGGAALTGDVMISLSPQGTVEAPDLAGPRGSKSELLRQSEEDYILAQILKYFPPNIQVSGDTNGVLSITIFIREDGTLAHPINMNDPWNPGSVIYNYQELVRMGMSYKREILEGFYVALRLSQPLELSGLDTARWPKRMVVRFKLKDVWQHTGNRR